MKRFSLYIIVAVAAFFALPAVAQQQDQPSLATLQQKEANEPSEFRKQMYRDAYNNQQTTLGEFAEKKAKAEKELAEAQAKETEEGPKPKKQKKAAAGTADQSKQEEPPQ